jgi:hypothetical protein
MSRSRPALKVFQPRKHHKGLVGTIVRVSPAVGAARIEETGQQSVRALAQPVRRLKHTGTLKFGDAREFISGQST